MKEICHAALINYQNGIYKQSTQKLHTFYPLNLKSIPKIPKKKKIAKKPQKD